MKTSHTLHPSDQIQAKIVVLRGQRVLLDSDLAALYGVETKRLKEQVRRNPERFPTDFCFQINREELAHLRSQIATSSLGHGGHRYLPFAFTEHGALQVANVVSSPRALQMSIAVIRAFVELRQLFATHRALSSKLDALELRVGKHDQELAELVQALRLLMQPPATSRRRIGFHQGNR